MLYGESKSFNCTASGIPEPTVVWYKDEKIVVNETGVSVTKDMLLTLSEITVQRNGVYKCVARSLGGTISSNAIVNVYCKICLFLLVHCFPVLIFLVLCIKVACSLSKKCHFKIWIQDLVGFGLIRLDFDFWLILGIT